MKNLEQASAEHMCILDAACLTPRAVKVLTFAKKRGLDKGEITCPDGTIRSAAEYAVQLYANADCIGNGDNPSQDEKVQESYQIVALLMAMEAIRTDNWTYGSKLLYDLRLEGIKLNRSEVAAFLAQEGTWDNNGRDKGANMDGNVLATAFYCGHLATIYGSLLGRMCVNRGAANEEMTKAVAACVELPTPQECVESLLQMFVIPFAGEVKQNRVQVFIQWLKCTDFYYAPASNRYHGSHPSGLVKHIVCTILRLMDIEKPATVEAVGKIVLTVLCHDLCKVNFYKQTWKNVKVYCENGDKYDPDGKRFRWESQPGYEIRDEMPFGHGRKSLYMATGLLGDILQEDMAAAIDGHMRDEKMNPGADAQLMQYPLALKLHMADVLSSHLDEEAGTA